MLTDDVVDWTAGIMALAVAVAELLRVRAARGAARWAAGVEVLMAVCMAVMAVPVTAGWIGGRTFLAGAFAALGLACAAAGVRDTGRRGWRRGRHWFHHAAGCGAMACMALAMGHGVTSSGTGGMAGMAGMHPVTTVWAAACAVLAVYFLLAMGAGVRSRLLGGYGEEAVTVAASGVAPVGRIAMGGVMAVMLLLMV